VPERLCSLSVVGITLRGPLRVTTSKVQPIPNGEKANNRQSWPRGESFNSPATWRHIATAMKAQATCVSSSHPMCGARSFGLAIPPSVGGYARFVMGNGESIYLRSSIFRADEQRALIERAGLSVVRVDHVLVRELPVMRSGKISDYLERSDPILDIYLGKKQRGQNRASKR
jgi:hypothetical protein